PERLAVERDRAARRYAEAVDGEELEVRAVVARRLKSRGACAFGDPGRRGQLVERAGLAASHRIAGKGEEITPEIRFADPVNRIAGAGVHGAGEDDDEDGGGSSLRAHAGDDIRLRAGALRRTGPFV